MAYLNNNDARYAQREISRLQGIDPGIGASLENNGCSLAPGEMPTLDAMTLEMNAPPIRPAGTPPPSRIESRDAHGGRAPTYARHWHAPETLRVPGLR